MQQAQGQNAQAVSAKVEEGRKQNIQRRPIVRALMSGALALGVALAPVPNATTQAQAMTVFDPINYAENLLQAMRALEQVNNQIRQIEQAAAMLKQNPLQLSPELTQSLSEARALFRSAQGIAFEVDRLSSDLRTLYPETWRDFDLEEVANQSDRWMAESRQSLERAMAEEARAAQSVEGVAGRIDRALQSSSSAEGQTGAIQASNQLLGIQASELAQLRTLLIAQGRALETERLERMAREARAREVERRAFPTDLHETFVPARSAFGG